MPYVSNKQRKFFHTPTAARSGITKADVKEFDNASRGMKLPEKVAPPPKHKFKFSRPTKTR